MTTLTGQLKKSGLSIAKGGRPPKTRRDMAIYLAAEWFRAEERGKGAKSIERAVLNLFKTINPVGLSEEAHVRARIQKAKKSVLQIPFDAKKKSSVEPRPQQSEWLALVKGPVAANNTRMQRLVYFVLASGLDHTIHLAHEGLMKKYPGAEVQIARSGPKCRERRAWVIVTKGKGENLKGAGVLLAEDNAVIACRGLLRVDGFLWAWNYGEEEAYRFCGSGSIRVPGFPG